MFFKNKKKPSPWLLLSNPITRLSLPEDEFSKLLYGFLAREPLPTFAERSRQLLRIKRFQDFQNFSAATVERFGRYDVLGSQFKEVRAWIYFAEVISTYAEQINRFVELRALIETAVIQGCTQQAIDMLDSLEKQFGESLWSIRSRGLLIEETGTEKEVDSFYSNIEARNKSPLIKFTLKSIRLITSSEHATQRLKSLILATINEFRNTNEADLVGFLHILLCPDPLIAKESVRPALHLLQLLPVIDLYVVLLDLCVHEKAQSSLLPDIQKFLFVIGSKINDPVLGYLNAEKDETRKTQLSKQGAEILKLYEEGAYAHVIKYFESVREELPNPLAYANVVAKSAAQAGVLFDKKSILDKLISSLIEIYRLTSQTAQATEAIKGISIRLNHFLLGNQVQLCLYKALPIQYKPKEVEIAAQIAILLNKEVSPQTVRLAGASGFGSRYGLGVETIVPPHRQIKREICCLGTASFNREIALQKLSELKKSGGLVKDYLEMFSEYCLEAECWAELLDEAAEHLIQNSESIVSIPMQRLVEYIEEQEPTSVQALVVAAKYVKVLDDSKDYVLHESVERYLEKLNVSRPSELLSKSIAPLRLSERHFFREICALDVMDYLSCFTSSDELRAERVMLLDLMLEKKEIEPQFRMREIEDMVAQMIVDAGTTAVSGPKIYVDTSAIIRKISDEMSALFTTFKSASDTETINYQVLDRISIDDGEITTEESTLKFARVIGGRNSLLLKMFGVAKEAFLFDEKNGLDKNLSTEIRHGFFSNLIRARLEERHLITELDDRGEYTPNLHWKNATELLLDIIINDVDQALRKFSSGINASIAEAEEWMKIERSDNEGQGMMFELPIPLFEKIKDEINHVNDSQAATSIIVENLWALTEFRIGEVHEKVNTIFRGKIDDLFSTLETEVTLSKRGAPLIDLTTAIVQTRGEIRDDITIAAEWFRRTDATSIASRYLPVAIQIAAKAFERIRGLMDAIENKFDEKISSVIVHGPAVRPLTIALVNLFDNAFRHSGYGRETTVNVYGVSLNGRIQIDIKNPVSPDRVPALTNEFLETLNKKAHSSASIELLRAEGGTGVVKAYQQVLASHSDSDLTLAFHEGHFIAKIVYGDKTPVY